MTYSFRFYINPFEAKTLACCSSLDCQSFLDGGGSGAKILLQPDFLKNSNNSNGLTINLENSYVLKRQKMTENSIKEIFKINALLTDYQDQRMLLFSQTMMTHCLREFRSAKTLQYSHLFLYLNFTELSAQVKEFIDCKFNGTQRLFSFDEIIKIDQELEERFDENHYEAYLETLFPYKGQPLSHDFAQGGRQYWEKSLSLLKKIIHLKCHDQSLEFCSSRESVSEKMQKQYLNKLEKRLTKRHLNFFEYASSRMGSSYAHLALELRTQLYENYHQILQEVQLIQKGAFSQLIHSDFHWGNILSDGEDFYFIDNTGGEGHLLSEIAKCFFGFFHSLILHKKIELSDANTVVELSTAAKFMISQRSIDLESFIKKFHKMIDEDISLKEKLIENLGRKWICQALLLARLQCLSDCGYVLEKSYDNFISNTAYFHANHFKHQVFPRVLTHLQAQKHLHYLQADYEIDLEATNCQEEKLCLWTPCLL